MKLNLKRAHLIPLNLKQKGVSLVEALLVIVIGATIIAMSIRFITQNSFTSKVAQASSVIQQLADASYEWLQGQSQLDFDGNTPVSIDTLYKAGLINFDCPAGSASCKNNPWGGAIAVTAYEDDPQYVKIQFSHIPMMACRSLANRMQSTNYKDQTQANNCQTTGSYFIAL